MKILRWVGIVLLIIVVLLGALVGYVFIASNARMNRVYDVAAPADIELPNDEESLAEGERLFISRGCGGCHGPNGGGTLLLDDPAVGYLASSNLTSGTSGVADQYESSGDWLRAIRHGLDPENKPLLFMPAHEFTHFSDEDLGMIIAYIESLEPVDSDFKEPSPGPVARALFLAGQMPLIPAELIDQDNVAPWDVEVAASVEYGEYLARSCIGCHGEQFSGGKIPGAPPDFPSVANITPHETGIEGWTLEEFQTAIQNGVRPDGEVLDTFMPWNELALLTDVEVEALYMYLMQVEPLEEGNR